MPPSRATPSVLPSRKNSTLATLPSGSLAVAVTLWLVATTDRRANVEQGFDVPVTVSAVLGSSRIAVGDLLRVTPGTVLELDRKVGEAIDIFVNNRLVARGEAIGGEEAERLEAEQRARAAESSEASARSGTD